MKFSRRIHYKLDLKGIDFVITEFFCIVVISQLIGDKSYISTSVGIISSIIAFLIMGSNFIVLAIFLSMLTLLILKKKLTAKEVDKHE